MAKPGTTIVIVDETEKVVKGQYENTPFVGASRRLGYTGRGQLVARVALDLEILERHAARLSGFPVEVKSVLQQLIVSHGEIQKGALRVPMFPEALASSMADLLDARLNQAWRLIDQAPAGGEWTAYIPSLERQVIAGARWQKIRRRHPRSEAMYPARTLPPRLLPGT